jgi:hypothetical protein
VELRDQRAERLEPVALGREDDDRQRSDAGRGEVLLVRE